ncbi:MAG TPA: ABC transporter ATP-binding protein [Actinomycetota bacterium]|nr:ABC transporter ATP-binding protein [Actinomycetota bacterium]
MNAIEASGLFKRYGAFEAVRGIDFSIAARECYGFLGPNGAGKTTTMRMITGTAEPTTGTMSVLGLRVPQDGRHIRARIGVVPQENNLDEELTVIDNLIVYARYFDIPRSVAAPRADELLTFVALQDKRDWLVTKLSGGMKRRLLIARALMNKPEVLVLDEPTTGLDPQARHLVWEKLRALKREGVTLVMTTHYMDEASQLCDRLVIMHEGRILIEGRPRDLIAKEIPRHVIEVMDSEFTLPVRMNGLVERVEHLADRVLLYTTDGDRLLKRVRTAAAEPDSVWLRGATLEDVFLHLTGRGLLE